MWLLLLQRGFLDGWALVIAMRAEHTAIISFGCHSSAAVATIVFQETDLGGQRFGFAMLTLGASNGGCGNNSARALLHRLLLGRGLAAHKRQANAQQ